MNDFEILFDGPGRHLVCIPYNVENLHRMASLLGVKRCWYHASARWPHYDAPKRRIKEIAARCDVTVVDSMSLFRSIRDSKDSQ